MEIQDFKRLVDTLLAYTNLAPMTANAHKDAQEKAQTILNEFVLLLQRAELATPVAEKIATEAKVVGGVASKKK
jgi:hypothetical protein